MRRRQYDEELRNVCGHTNQLAAKKGNVMVAKSSGCIQVDIGLKSNPCGACNKCYRKRKRRTRAQAAELASRATLAGPSPEVESGEPTMLDASIGLVRIR